MLEFYCNKRFDISFSNFHKLIKLILPTNYESIETRGTYRIDYMPCNIIEVYKKQTEQTSREHIGNIYCWLGQKGLTVLSDRAETVSLCIEATKEIKQNPEDYRVLSYPLIDEQSLIDKLSNDDNALLVYKQLNSSNDTSKYIIKEYNNDEVLLEFYRTPDSVRLSGAITSLFTLVQLAIETILRRTFDNTQINKK